MKEYLEKLEFMGYNILEKSFIYAGALTGSIAPLAATWHFSRKLVNPEDALQEGLVVLGSLALNASTIVKKPHLPIPAYTGLGGLMAGEYLARKSIRIRNSKKRNLEKITK